MRSTVAAYLSLALGACSPTGFLNMLSDTSNIDISRDTAYAPGNRHTLDIYAPRAANGAPLAVFYYGGGWDSGAKESYAFVATALANQGIVTIVPDYRIFPEARFPDFLTDAAQAVRWAKDHAQLHGADPQRLILIGHSAGAHIAAMLTLDGQWLASVGLDARRDIAGAVGLAGPYDFLPLTSDRLKAIFGAPDRLARTQPINFVDGSAAPLLLITGLSDSRVDPGNSRRLAQRVADAGGTVRLITYPNIGHGLLVGAVGRPLRFLAPTLADVSAFIKNQPRAAIHTAAR